MPGDLPATFSALSDLLANCSALSDLLATCSALSDLLATCSALSGLDICCSTTRRHGVVLRQQAVIVAIFAFIFQLPAQRALTVAVGPQGSV
jgi:hypothetical protein